MSTRITLSTVGESPFEQLLGHNTSIQKNWGALETSFFEHTNLCPALLEQVRRVLAFGNQCQYCMAKGRPNEVKQDGRESLATTFAELFILDHLSIVDGHFHVLREAFTEKEIAELCAFITFISASQRLGAIINLTPAEKASEE